MAMIKCPECGKEISSSATHCVGCGCEISYCPECGNVHIGKPTACAACGYQFIKKEEESLEVEHEQVKKHLKDIADLKKISSILQYCSYVLCVVLMLVTAFVLIQWATKDGFEQLNSVQTVYNLSLAFCALVAIIISFKGIWSFSLGNFCSNLRVWGRLRISKFDAKKYILSHLGEDQQDKAAVLFMDHLMSAVYMHENPNAKTIQLFEILESCVCAIIFIVAGAVLAKENISYFILWGSDFQFQFTAAFYAAVVGASGLFLSYVIGSDNSRKKRKYFLSQSQET